ncbi:hypothetical protein GCM10009624_08620 [Gordonia sinesedis]
MSQEATDRWADMLDEITRQRTELDRVHTALAELTAHAVSADRLVSVTVDARGLLIDLTIAPAALRRYRAEQLSAAVTDLVAEADGHLRGRRERLLDAAAVSRLEPAFADLRTQP